VLFFEHLFAFTKYGVIANTIVVTVATSVVVLTAAVAVVNLITAAISIMVALVRLGEARQAKPRRRCGP
jgi:hypothetical protein